MTTLVVQETIEKKIYLLRGQKVMLDKDLAELYGVPLKVMIQAVKRNKESFPDDFIFQLTWDEAVASRSQIVTLKKGQNIKYLPYAFTEQGVAMLSSVLKSKQAIQMKVAIMRVFVKLREILSTHKELAYKLNELERKIEKHDVEIHSLFEAIRQLMAIPEKPKQQIGFSVERL